MLKNNKYLKVDIKLQDRLRKWFAQRGEDFNLKKLIIKAVSLGDSDVDYRLSEEPQKMVTLNAPYNINNIVNKLVYSGNETNLSGKIIWWNRRIKADGTLESLYFYPPNKTTYQSGGNPPTKENGFEPNKITFDNFGNNRGGVVVFLQSLPDNEFDENLFPKRLNEKYEIEVIGLPTNPEFNIINIQEISSQVVITTDVNHNLQVDQKIKITNLTSALELNNKNFLVGSPTSNTFVLRTLAGVDVDPGIVSPYTTNDGKVTEKQWEFIFDENESGFILAKDYFIVSNQGLNQGLIKVTGKNSGFYKEIIFDVPTK